MADELEEGEIEGELGAEPAALEPEAEAEAEVAEVLPEELPAKRVPPKERLLAMTPSGRAPYYAEPGSGGFSGRGPGGGGGKGGKKKRKQQAAAGFVDIYGQGAHASVEVYAEQGPIRLSDVQNLLLWVLAEGSNPRWCFVKNKPLVKKVLLLVAHGVDRQTWEQEGQQLLPAWHRHLGPPIELQARNATLAPGSTVHSLLTVPQTKKRRREEGQAVPPPPPPPPAAQPAAATADSLAAEAAAAAAEAAHGEASPAGTGAAAGAAGAGAAADTPAAGPAAAKRMRVAAADDVSSRVQPLLLEGQAAAAAAGAAGGSAGVVPAAGAPAAAAAPAAAITTAAPAAAAMIVAGSPAAPAHQLQQQQPEQQQQQLPVQVQLAGGGSYRRCTLPPSHYVLSLDELQQHKYPLPQFDEAGELVCPEGFVATQNCKGGPQHDLVGVDCEMCITEQGFELTRVTLVDRQGQVLLDELVVPFNPITDHNTRFSGITAAMLEGVTTRLPDVQAAIRGLVAAETVLVAHSGDNDLQALKIIHANVIDTSVLYPHPRGPPYKSALRVLASRHLLRTIQQGEHNPVEDARAAMDLALLKFERGPTYGAGGGERGDRLLDVLGEHDRRSTMVDRLEVLNRHVTGNCSAVVAEGDETVAAHLCKELQKPKVDFVWGQLTALQRFYDSRVEAAKESGEPEPSAAYRQQQQQQQQDGQQQQQQGNGAQEQTGHQQQQNGQQQEQHSAEMPPPPPPQPPPHKQQGGQQQAEGEQQQQQQQEQETEEAQEQQQADGQEQRDGQQQGSEQQQAGSPEQTPQQQQQESRQQRQAVSAEQLQQASRQQQAAALASLDASVQQLWEAAPGGTLLLVVTGQGDTSYSRYIQEQKWRRQQGLDGLPPWSPACEWHLAAAQDRAMCALCFAAVKPQQQAPPQAGQ